MKELPEGLFEAVKNNLNITWDDPDGDKNLDGVIRRGMAAVQEWTARNLEFEEGTIERTLLFEYCVYARSGLLSDFFENYRSMIVSFRDQEAVKHYRSTENEETGDSDV